MTSICCYLVVYMDIKQTAFTHHHITISRHVFMSQIEQVFNQRFNKFFFQVNLSIHYSTSNLISEFVMNVCSPKENLHLDILGQTFLCCIHPYISTGLRIWLKVQVPWKIIRVCERMTVTLDNRYLNKICQNKILDIFFLSFQYFLMVVVIFLLEIVAGILAFVYRDEVG